MPDLPLQTRHRVLRGLAWLSTIACALVVLAFHFRAPLLTGVAKLWVIDESPAKADAIVVLGGSPELRPFEAARLYHEGIAPRILYMDVMLPPSAELGITLSERELTHRILLSNGIPENAMTAIGRSVASTYDESSAVRAWIDKTGAKTIVIPTDIFPTRRTRWIFQKRLKEAGGHVYVEAITPKRYSISNWWHHEEGLIAFESEFIKSAYYHWKY